jgi:predicted Zn-dependent peptidase
MLTVKKHLMANGLRLVAVEMPHLHSAELAVYLKVGGRNDPADRAGLSHFLEHMLFRGTADYATSLELELAFEAIGGNVNASTDEETTCYFSRVHPDRCPEGLAIFASMLLRPTLPGIEVERQIITEESLDDLNERGEEINPHNLTSRLFWPDHPLGRPTIGFPEAINAIAAADLNRHLQQFYSPANAVVIAAGAIDSAAFFQAATAAFGNWRGVPPPATLPCPDLFAGPATLFVADSDSQVHLQFAFRGFPRDDRRLTACRLIRRLLTGGGSARLYLLLREQLGIIYSVEGNLAAYDETGAFTIDVSTAPDNVPTAVAAVLGELGRLTREPLTAAELQRIKQAYFYDLDYSRDSTYEMQVRYGWGELMQFVRSIDDDCRAAEQVTADDILTVARELFAPRRLAIVAVGPTTSAHRRAVEEAIKGYGGDA